MITMYIPDPTPALTHAAAVLKSRGIRFTDSAEEAEFLLYPVPTPLDAMAEYTTDQTIIGGNLDFLNESVARLDLLRDEHYLAENAAITAEAALGLLLGELKGGICDTNILILGWGRIGKCLTHQLHHLDAHATVYARKESDRAMLRALGYHAVTRQELHRRLSTFGCVLNTAPAQILTTEEARMLRPDCLKLELASGCFLPGGGVIQAKGLPGRCKPEAAGKLIARTILEHLGGK